jgi:hypothetical protein
MQIAQINPVANLLSSISEVSKAFVEAISDPVRGVIVEYRLRREFRKPLGEEPELGWYRPYLNHALATGRRAKIADKVLMWNTENLNKQGAKAKRRDLCVVSEVGDLGGSIELDGIKIDAVSM